MNNEQQSAYPVVLPHPDADYAKGLTKLDAFTMAAIKGLCHMAGTDVLVCGGLTVQQIDNISECAIAIAKATLSKLQNAQP